MSTLGYILNDFVIDTVKRLIDKIYTVYDKITDNLIGKSDFPEAPEKKDKKSDTMNEYYARKNA